MKKAKNSSNALRRRRKASLADSPKMPPSGPDSYPDSSPWVATSTPMIQL